MLSFNNLINYHYSSHFKYDGLDQVNNICDLILTRKQKIVKLIEELNSLEQQVSSISHIIERRRNHDKGVNKVTKQLINSKNRIENNIKIVKGKILTCHTDLIKTLECANQQT